jgi:hypothetical protein
MYEGYGQNVISPQTVNFKWPTFPFVPSFRTENGVDYLKSIQELKDEIKLLKEQLEELSQRVTEMELAPGGPLYLQAKEHFTELSQIK